MTKEKITTSLTKCEENRIKPGAKETISLFKHKGAAATRDPNTDVAHLH